MRKLLLITGLLLATNSFSQNYSYRFSGKMNPELSAQIENELASDKGFQNIKFRIKEQSGELLFQFILSDSNKERTDFSPLSYVKSVLISKGLEPLEVVELSK